MIELSKLNLQQDQKEQTLVNIEFADTRGYILGYGGLRHSILSTLIQRVLMISILISSFFLVSDMSTQHTDPGIGHGTANQHTLSRFSYFKFIMSIYPIINFVVGIDNFIIFIRRKNHKFFLSTSVFNLLLALLDYFLVYNYWNYNYVKDSNGKFVVTGFHKFTRVLCFIFPLITLLFFTCTAEKSLQFKNKSWHVAVGKLPIIWIPIVINSFLIRYLFSLYIAVDLDNAIIPVYLIGATLIVLFVSTHCALSIRVKNKIGNSMVSVTYFLDGCVYFVQYIIITFFEKQLIRTSSRDHMIAITTIATMFSILALISWLLTLLGKGRYVFWRADCGVV